MSDMQILFKMVDVLDLAEKTELFEYLGEKIATPLNKEAPKRILGLFGGEGFYMSDDFDVELPDEFWGFEKDENG